MKRTEILFGKKRLQMLGVLAGAVLAASVVVGSGASFTAQTANPSNVFSSGTLAMSNTDSGMSTRITDMVPGDSHSGTVTIENTGTVQGNFYLEPVAITSDSMGEQALRMVGPSFAQQLQLEIREGEHVLYRGALSDLKQHDLKSWAAGEKHTYEFTVSFPDQGRDEITGEGLDNVYMGASTTAEFTWTAVSVARGSL